MRNPNAPFGNPDGSRADIDDVLHEFVDFPDETTWGGIAMRRDDFTARVIVGRKGSGKTVYLRRLQASAADANAIYADAFPKYVDDIQQNYPNTDLVVKFCNWFKPADLTEKWRELWRRAILRSLYTHLVYSDGLKHLLKPNRKKQLLETYSTMLPIPKTPLSIYSQVTEIIHQMRSDRQFVEFCNSPLWESLEYELATILHNAPPVCFFVDAVDEEFAHAPMYWLRCQKGLFYQVMRFLRDSRLGSRLHIFICIRDIVLASVFRGEHQTRYRNEPHIRLLKWDLEAIRYLLRQKVNTLPHSFFFNPQQENSSVSSWLGVEHIANISRNIEENIEDYLLRHTRLLPRDTVILGNDLCLNIARNRNLGIGKSPEEIIKDCVHRCAEIFAKEQLAICANHLSSDTMPARAAAHEYAEVYTSAKEYIATFSESLRALLGNFTADRFTRGDIDQTREFCRTQFGDPDRPFSVLWQHGLIGYINSTPGRPPVVFYSEDHLDDFLLPQDVEGYAMHPCLCDLVHPKLLGAPVMPS